MKFQALVLFAAATLAASLVGCASEDSGQAGEDPGMDEAAATAAPRAWYAIVERGGNHYVQPANRSNLVCADGQTDVRCKLGTLDVKALRLSTKKQAFVTAQMKEDTLLVYGQLSKGTQAGGQRVMNLKATRVFHNILRVFPEGDLYEVKTLGAAHACTLARFVPPPPRVFAPPTLETFDATCTHSAQTLNSVQHFDVNEPDWASREQWLPLGASSEVVADLAAGSSVITNGNWMTNRQAPFSSPTPVQIFRDIKRISVE